MAALDRVARGRQPGPTTRRPRLRRRLLVGRFPPGDSGAVPADAAARLPGSTPPTSRLTCRLHSRPTTRPMPRLLSRPTTRRPSRLALQPTFSQASSRTTRPVPGPTRTRQPFAPSAAATSPLPAGPRHWTPSAMSAAPGPPPRLADRRGAHRRGAAVGDGPLGGRPVGRRCPGAGRRPRPAGRSRRALPQARAHATAGARSPGGAANRPARPGTGCREPGSWRLLSPRCACSP